MTLRFRTLGFWSAALFATTMLATGCASGDGDEDEGGAGSGGGDVGSGGSDAGSGGGDQGSGGDMGATGGGDSGPVSVCDDNSFPPESDEVSDAEEATGWDIYESTPGEGTLTTPASFEDEPALVDVGEGGAPDSTMAVHYAGTGFLNYGTGINFNLEGCKDLSAYTGVSFWIKGESTVAEEDQMPPNAESMSTNFRVITAGSHAIIMDGDVNVGGDCDASKQPNKCFLPPQIDIDLTAEWVEHKIAFDDLKTPAGANPGSAFDGMNAMLLGWHTSAADVDIYVDNVAFY